jgi:four helix bundle protein
MSWSTSSTTRYNKLNNLEIYRLAKVLAKQIYTLIYKLPTSENYGVASQITRAVNSIGANIAEGYARQTKADQKHFMIIARGSLSELIYFLDIGMELDWWARQDIDQIIKHTINLEVKLQNYIKTL